MNGSSGVPMKTNPIFNGDKYGDNNNKYELKSTSSENTSLPQQKQKTQQQQPQIPAGGTTQLKRTQSIISQNLRDQQYQMYCSSTSPPLQQLQQPSHQQSMHNTFSPMEDTVLYCSGAVRGGQANQATPVQQRTIAGTHQFQQQYPTMAVVNNLPADTSYSSSNNTSSSAMNQNFYNKHDGGGLNVSTGDGTQFNCHQQTYQQQDVLYQPYQPEYVTYQQPQKFPFNHQQQQQQIQQQQRQHLHLQYNQLKQPQQQFQPQQNQQYQPGQEQYQRFPNQDQQQQQQLLGTINDPQYHIVEQQQQVDNNNPQNVAAITHSGGLVTSSGMQYTANDMVGESASTSFRPLQHQPQQGQMVQVSNNVV